MIDFYDLPLPAYEAETRSQKLSMLIKKEIDRQGGMITFADFMTLALYHKELGYYMVPEFLLGEEGDFTTAPEISPLFAQCFARQCQAILSDLSHPTILELGAGTGRFALELLYELEALEALPSHYVIYEISEHLRERQYQLLKKHCPHLLSRIHWLKTLPATVQGIVIANEVMDALPVHCFCVHAEGICERTVGYNPEGFFWKTKKPEPLHLQRLSKLSKIAALQIDDTFELNLQLSALVATLAQSLEKGAILIADYGHGRRELYHPRRNRSTLSCYYRHRLHANPLILVGLQDITADIDFTEIAEVATHYGCKLSGFTTQAAFLFSCGLAEIMTARAKNLANIDQYQEAQAIKLLTFPTEMGEKIKIMALTKSIKDPLLGFMLKDSRQEL